MKQVYLLAALLAASVSTATAIELNTDALKSMQQEGHKIVEESQGARAYKSIDGFCLDIVGAGLVVKTCNGNAKTQRWMMDDQRRLVAHDGRCVGGVQLQKCGATPAQKWLHDEKKRLVNDAKKCLQPRGNPVKSGVKLMAVGCSNAPGQVWK